MDKDSYMLIEQPKYGCSFIEAIKRFYKKYAVFRGRASRSEYWFVSLFYFLVSLAVIILSAIAKPLAVIIGIAFLLFCLASIVPSIALYARRLHDVNISAWFIVIQLVLSIIGFIITMSSSSNTDANYSITSSSSSIDASFGSSNVLPMFIFNTIPAIIAFIFVLLPSKPAGVRFDRNPNATAGMQSMPASPALTPQSQYPAQQQQYAGMQDNMTNNYAVNAGSVSNNTNHGQYTGGGLMNAHRPTGSHYAQSAQQYSQSSYQNSGMPAMQAPMPTGYQVPQQYQPTQQAVSSNDDYLGYVVEQSQQVNPNMHKRSHYGATASAGSVNISSFDDTDIQLDDNDGNSTNAR
jgi:uncharacterized membrane protein YhaH (DUF805 family)